MSYKLFLDDERYIQDVTWVDLPIDHSWGIVRSYNEFVKTITEHGLPEVISFDHDLADEHYPWNNPSDNPCRYDKYKEKTGYDCAKWLVEYCILNHKKLPKWYVHSHNIFGKENIERILSNFKEDC
jgi:hypothetical protein